MLTQKNTNHEVLLGVGVRRQLPIGIGLSLDWLLCHWHSIGKIHFFLFLQQSAEDSFWIRDKPLCPLPFLSCGAVTGSMSCVSVLLCWKVLFHWCLPAPLALRISLLPFLRDPRSFSWGGVWRRQPILRWDGQRLLLTTHCLVVRFCVDCHLLGEASVMGRGFLWSVSPHGTTAVGSGPGVM